MSWRRELKSIILDYEGLAITSLKVGAKICVHGVNSKVAGLQRIKQGNLIVVYYEDPPKKKK